MFPGNGDIIGQCLAGNPNTVFAAQTPETKSKLWQVAAQVLVEIHDGRELALYCVRYKIQFKDRIMSNFERCNKIFNLALVIKLQAKEYNTGKMKHLKIHKMIIYMIVRLFLQL